MIGIGGPYDSYFFFFLKIGVIYTILFPNVVLKNSNSVVLFFLVAFNRSCEKDRFVSHGFHLH